MKINIRLPDWIDDLITAEAQRDYVSKTSIIINSLKDRYRKQSPDVGEVVRAEKFWPSGWPHDRVIIPHDYCGITRGPWCNKCDREHDPMEHPDNDEDVLALVLRRYETGITS